MDIAVCIYNLWWHAYDIQDPAKKPKKLDQSLKASRPTGMNREVYALLYADSNSRYNSYIYRVILN